MHCAVASAIISKHKIASIETMFQLSDSRVMGSAPQTCKNFENKFHGASGSDYIILEVLVVEIRCVEIC